MIILTPLFTQWDPYSLFFDKLMPLLTQKKEFHKGTIIPIRKMVNKVKELNAFFFGMVQEIKKKMRTIVQGVAR